MNSSISSLSREHDIKTKRQKKYSNLHYLQNFMYSIWQMPFIMSSISLTKAIFSFDTILKLAVKAILKKILVNKQNHKKTKQSLLCCWIYFNKTDDAKNLLKIEN